MPGWIVPLIAVLGAILVPIIAAIIKEKRRQKEVKVHGGDKTVRDDISADIDAAVGRMRPGEARPDSEAPGCPDADNRGAGLGKGGDL